MTCAQSPGPRTPRRSHLWVATHPRRSLPDVVLAPFTAIRGAQPGALRQWGEALQPERSLGPAAGPTTAEILS